MLLGTVLLIVHIIVSVLICIVILMQSAKGEGLSGAFGLGQGTTTFFGADTANVLVKITTVLAVVFMLTSISLAYVQSRKARPVALEAEAAGEPAMTAPPGEEGEETEEGEEATVPEGETAPEAGEPQEPGATDETAVDEAPDEPAVEPGAGEADQPDVGEPLEPAGTES